VRCLRFLVLTRVDTSCSVVNICLLYLSVGCFVRRFVSDSSIVIGGAGGARCGVWICCDSVLCDFNDDSAVITLKDT
jgi:hypothetical protein